MMRAVKPQASSIAPSPPTCQTQPKSEEKLNVVDAAVAAYPYAAAASESAPEIAPNPTPVAPSSVEAPDTTHAASTSSLHVSHVWYPDIATLPAMVTDERLS